MPANGQQRGAGIDREAARSVACPRCGAEPGERCFGTRGRLRERNHAVRVGEAIARATAEANARLRAKLIGT